MNETPAAIHPFEKAGLGIAPFRCINVETRVYQACPGADAQPGGTCDYCGTAIKTCCVIKSKDGRKFIVGSDCVAKTYRECASTDAERSARKLHDEVNRIKTAKANARKDGRIEAAREALAANFEAWDALIWDGVVRHSYGPRSVARQLEWMLANGGRALKMRGVDLVEAMLA